MSTPTIRVYITFCGARELGAAVICRDAFGRLCYEVRLLGAHSGTITHVAYGDVVLA